MSSNWPLRVERSQDATRESGPLIFFGSVVASTLYRYIWKPWPMKIDDDDDDDLPNLKTGDFPDSWIQTSST